MMNLLLLIKNFIHKYKLIILGCILMTLYFWNRFFHAKVSKELVTVLDNIYEETKKYEQDPYSTFGISTEKLHEINELHIQINQAHDEKLTNKEDTQSINETSVTQEEVD